MGALVAPVIPGLTDHEIPAIVSACARAGARVARHILLRLPHAVAPLFEDWLARHFPERRVKVMSRIRAVRDGRVNDPRFHSRMTGSGIFADQIHALFELAESPRRSGGRDAAALDAILSATEAAAARALRRRAARGPGHELTSPTGSRLPSAGPAVEGHAQDHLPLPAPSGDHARAIRRLRAGRTRAARAQAPSDPAALRDQHRRGRAAAGRARVRQPARALLREPRGLPASGSTTRAAGREIIRRDVARFMAGGADTYSTTGVRAAQVRAAHGADRPALSGGQGSRGCSSGARA